VDSTRSMANVQDEQAPTSEVGPSTSQLHAMKAMETQACSQGKTLVEHTCESYSPRFQEHIPTDEYELEDESDTNEQVLLSSATMTCQSKSDDNKTVKSERHSSTPASSDSSSSESNYHVQRFEKEIKISGYIADDSDSSFTLQLQTNVQDEEAIEGCISEQPPHSHLSASKNTVTDSSEERDSSTRDDNLLLSGMVTDGNRNTPSPEVGPSTSQLHAMKAMETQACSQGNTQVEPTSERDSPRLQEHIPADEYELEDESYTNEQVLLSSATMACQSKSDYNKTVKSERLTSGHSGTPTSTDSSSGESNDHVQRFEKESKLSGYLADDSNSDSTLAGPLSSVVADSNRNRGANEPCVRIARLNPSAELPSRFLASDEENSNLQTMESSTTNQIFDPPGILSGVLDGYEIPDFIRERIGKYLYFTLFFIYP